MDERAKPEIVSVDDWINAAHRGDVPFVLNCLRRGMDVDARGSVQATALMAAVGGGRLGMIRILLEHGANPNLECLWGHTAVSHGVFRARPQDGSEPDPGPMELLLAAGGRCRLYEAVLMNDIGLARARLDEGADPNANRGTYHGPLLTLAAVRGYLTMVEILLDFGADIEATDDLGQTPLICAARSGRTEVVSLLLDRGADIEAVDWFGKSARVTVEGRPLPTRPREE
jgi:uncharacterized protein